MSSSGTDKDKPFWFQFHHCETCEFMLTADAVDVYLCKPRRVGQFNIVGVVARYGPGKHDIKAHSWVRRVDETEGSDSAAPDPGEDVH